MRQPGVRRAARHRTIARIAVAVAALSVAALSLATLNVAAVSMAAVSKTASTGRRCRVPRLTGLTLQRAAVRAERAGCHLRKTGAPDTHASVQTVASQSPGAGRRAAAVTVRLNPFCSGTAAYPPAIKEPLVTAGPTELVSGFFLVGGPLTLFSHPHCSRPPPVTGAGSVVVTDPSGVVVARQTSARGHLVKIALAPGTYTISGTFREASFNGMHPARTEQVTIPPGDTVRQDFFLDVP